MVTRYDDTAIVAIGRNEGEGLVACLRSALSQVERVVYVDSGSTDGSVAMARELGAEVVELDTTIPFTAARARNAGFERLSGGSDGLAFVQFIDGDCELHADFIRHARTAMQAAENVVVVCGRRSERDPSHSPYNRLCDMEWDTPIGEAEECGGDALFRAEAFAAVGGYADDLIAGEEPELCVRLRARGGRVLRIDAAMTLHDARMDTFGQWWSRSVRAGHAAAEGVARHEAFANGDLGRQVRSAWSWAIGLPAAAAIASIALGSPGPLLLLLAYPLQIARIAARRPRPNFSQQDQWLYASACVLGKLPNVQGQIRYRLGRLTGRRSALIEYKAGPRVAEGPSRSPGS
jgi:GT2 family glycosyltransferase